MVPEFMIPADVQDEGIYEEQLCWENVQLQLKFFHEKGFKNIVALDFDDVRTRELPKLFRGYRFITLKLISSDTAPYMKTFCWGKLFRRSNFTAAKRKIRKRKISVESAVDLCYTFLDIGSIRKLSDAASLYTKLKGQRMRQNE